MSKQTNVIRFRPSVSLKLELGDYVVKTAECADEVEQALRLRHQVFYLEALGRSRPGGLDVDRFDPICDHLLVVESGSNRIVGTYRLNSSGDNYFSSQEFDISAILRLEGKKLEIGRACVAKSGRARGVFMMLWAGIAAYMRRHETRFLFGCVSTAPGEDPARVALLHHYLRRKHYSAEDRRVCSLRPLPACAAPQSGPPDDGTDRTTIRRLLPLLSVYLHAGAVVCGEPAFDETLGTWDFFTLLDLETASDAGSRLFRSLDFRSLSTITAFMRA